MGRDYRPDGWDGPGHLTGLLPRGRQPALLAGCVIRIFPATADDVGVDLDRAGTSDQIALHFVASFADQRPELVVGLDAFGKHGQPQSMRKADHRADNRERSVGAAEAGDE